jgi:hypothetical protein
LVGKTQKGFALSYGALKLLPFGAFAKAPSSLKTYGVARRRNQDAAAPAMSRPIFFVGSKRLPF